MDMMTLLNRIEKNFFKRIEGKSKQSVADISVWKTEEIKKEFNEAIKEVLVLTYSRVMRDAGKGKGGI
jgi:hypothetical protein